MIAAAAAPERVVRKPDRKAWTMLSLLSFVYVLNFLDRQLLAILALPIQESLDITDG
ncbi:MAG TPA: MFS transporter, partial [Erythrobacter sp.]|nr:MFS transporter [Erythrobacter sp.]